MTTNPEDQNRPDVAIKLARLTNKSRVAEVRENGKLIMTLLLSEKCLIFAEAMLHGERTAEDVSPAVRKAVGDLVMLGATGRLPE